MSQRIRAGAIRRAGELLKQLDGRGGSRAKAMDADSSAIMQTRAARAAGLTSMRLPLKMSEQAADLRLVPLNGISSSATLFGSDLCVWHPVLLL